MEERPVETLAFVLCRNAACGFSEGYADLRLAPLACPACGRILLRDCPHCGMLLRNRWGICTNCGRHLVVPDPLGPNGRDRYPRPPTPTHRLEG